MMNVSGISPKPLSAEQSAKYLKLIEAGCGGKETLYFWQDASAVYLQALHAFAPLWPHNIPQTFRRK